MIALDATDLTGFNRHGGLGSDRPNIDPSHVKVTHVLDNVVTRHWFVHTEEDSPANSWTLCMRIKRAMCPSTYLVERRISICHCAISRLLKDLDICTRKGRETCADFQGGILESYSGVDLATVLPPRGATFTKPGIPATGYMSLLQCGFRWARALRVVALSVTLELL